MNLPHARARLLSAGIAVTDVSARRVVACDADGDRQVYLRTPIGWRRRTHPRRDHGDLVTDPALCALLDAAVNTRT